VVGSGPNGLAAAVTLARAGRSVLVLEARETIGGGTRTAELTLPGFRHDVCAAIHPLVAASPFFRELPLAEHGLELVQPPVPLAHLLDGGSAVLLHRSVEETAAGLGRDADAYRRLIGPLVDAWPAVEREILGPLLHVPRRPLALARFALPSLLPAAALGRFGFRDEPARALLAGFAAHAIMPLERPLTAGFALVPMALAHRVGWPLARGGSQAIADALASYLRTLGGEIETGREVGTLDELPRTRSVFCDVTPRQLLGIAGRRLPARYRRALERFRYGPGVFKLDYALDGAVGWRDPRCAETATLHLGGSLESIAASERAPWQGRAPGRPFVIVAQQSAFDGTRAPGGKHTLWAYCHVPQESTEDVSERVEAELERHAPGFRELVLARSVRTTADLERGNPNLVGGDIAGGAHLVRQLVARPALRRHEWATPLRGLYLCSSSTPPGAGVHGMCGHLAAQTALRSRAV
jgi:phytoene dehydrogenase-like protein